MISSSESWTTFEKFRKKTHTIVYMVYITLQGLPECRVRIELFEEDTQNLAK
jgi:hypothetical protein